MEKKLKHILIIAALLSLTGCLPNAVDGTLEPSAQQSNIAKTQPGAALADGITITRVGVIEDCIAYYCKRGVYRIHDDKSGKDFIGIIGISEEIKVGGKSKHSVDE